MQTADVCSKVRIEPFEVRWLESGVLRGCGPDADLRATPVALLMERQRRAPSPCQSGSVLKIILKITREVKINFQKLLDPFAPPLAGPARG